MRNLRAFLPSIEWQALFCQHPNRLTEWLWFFLDQNGGLRRFSSWSAIDRCFSRMHPMVIVPGDPWISLQHSSSFSLMFRCTRCSTNQRISTTKIRPASALLFSWWDGDLCFVMCHFSLRFQITFVSHQHYLRIFFSFTSRFSQPAGNVLERLLQHQFDVDVGEMKSSITALVMSKTKMTPCEPLTKAPERDRNAQLFSISSTNDPPESSRNRSSPAVSH